jgi:hypothetical protein
MSVKLGSVTDELYPFALHLPRVQRPFSCPDVVTPGQRGIKLRREIT